MRQWRSATVIGLMMGCSGKSNDTASAIEPPPPPPPPETDTDPENPIDDALVRFTHMAIDLPEIDIFLNDDDSPLNIQPLEFTNGFPYISLIPDPYDISVSLTGESRENAEFSFTSEFAPYATLTITAIGTLDPSDNYELTAIVLDDSVDELEEGHFRIRAIHAASVVENVKIWNVTDPANPTSIIEDMAYGSYDSVVDIAAGEYMLGVDVQPADGQPELIFSLPNIPSGTLVNLYTTNGTEGDVFMVVQLSDGSATQIDPE